MKLGKTMNDIAVLIKNGESKRKIEKSGKIYKLMVESKNIEAIIAELDPGTESRWFCHDGEEIHFVIKGEMEYIVGDHSYILHEGDTLWHNSNQKHRAKNISTKKVAYITIGTPPTLKQSML